MEQQPILLEEFAKFVSDNLSYSTTHLNSLCVLQSPLSKELMEMMETGLVLGRPITGSQENSSTSVRAICLQAIRQMVSNIVSGKSTAQWIYGEHDEKGLYMELFVIDQSGKILRASSGESLNESMVPILDRYKDIIRWFIERYGNVRIEPISLYYTEMDRRDSLERIVLKNDNQTYCQKFIGFLQSRKDLLDFLTGNHPTDQLWKELALGREGSASLYRLANMHSIEAIKTAVEVLKRHTKQDISQ